MRKYLVFNNDIVGVLDTLTNEVMFYNKFTHLNDAYNDGVLIFEVNPNEWDSKAINLIIDYNYAIKITNEIEQ